MGAHAGIMRLRAVGKAGMKRAEPAPTYERPSRVMSLSARRTMLWRGFLYGIKAGRARAHLRTAESSDESGPAPNPKRDRFVFVGSAHAAVCFLGNDLRRRRSRAIGSVGVLQANLHAGGNRAQLQRHIAVFSHDAFAAFSAPVRHLALH